MNDKISKERLKWITETDPLNFMGTKVFIQCAEERYALARELIALGTAAEGLEKALAAIVCGECPVVTHHRPDCEWCAAIKALDAYRKVVGK